MDHTHTSWAIGLLYAEKITYQAKYNSILDSILTPCVFEESDEGYLSASELKYTFSYDLLDMVLPLNEAILEAMIGPEKICKDMHHKYYFLPTWVE